MVALHQSVIPTLFSPLQVAWGRHAILLTPGLLPTILSDGNQGSSVFLGG